MLLKHLPTALTQSPYLQRLGTELTPQQLLPSLIAGTLTGVIGVIRAISYAALIFSGSLGGDLNAGVGMAIMSSALISIVVAMTSSLPGMIATPLAAPTLVLAGLAADIAQRSPAIALPDLLPTVMAAIALGSLATGVILWMLGRLAWGNVMQFLPYPVIGGFMAGTGLLLVRGAFKVMTEKELAFQHLSWLSQKEHAILWIAGLGIAAVLLWATKQVQHYLVMPGVLFLAALGIYSLFWVYALPLETARTQGWLLGPFPQGHLWQPLTPTMMKHVQWEVIWQSSGTLGLLVFVSVLSLLLTNSSLELELDRDLDLNRELKAVGLANLVAGLGSTMAGNQALPSTLLVHRMGAATRLTGVFKALPCIAVLLLGPTFLNYFPKPVLGSLLLFLGLGLLWQWVYQAWFALSLMDYLIVLITLGSINIAGFIPGIAAGMGMAILQFLYEASQPRILAVQDAAPPSDGATGGDDIAALAGRSVTASPWTAKATDNAELPRLGDLADRVERVELQGFLFFGTAKALYQQLYDRLLLLAASGPAPRYLLLGCQRVLAIDTSAAMGLGKLANLASKHDCVLVFYQMTDVCQKRLMKSQALNFASGRCIVCSDSLTALQWCQKNYSQSSVSASSSPQMVDNGKE